MPAANVAILKKIYGLGHPSDLASRTTVLIVSNEEMEDVMKIAKSFEESGLFITIKIEAKEQKGRFLVMLLGNLGAILLGNLLTPKGTTGAGEGTIQAG